MRTLFLISESIKNLDLNGTTTSSEKYELNIAKSLSNYLKVVIISMRLKDSEVIQKNNLILIGVAGRGNQYKRINKIIQRQGNAFMIFWGYDFFKVKNLLHICRKNKIIGIPFIFDSYKPAIVNYSAIKKLMAQIYFNIGILLVKKFNGFIFFQENAVKRLKLSNKPFVIIKPGVLKTESNLQNADDKFIITYCGTLSTLNGVGALLKSLKYFNENDNVSFNIYGDGPLKVDVLEAQKKYSFLKYFGIVDDGFLNSEVYPKSSLLLNLRQLDDEAIDFAFPSKLFEYMNTGVPVLTTKLLNDSDFLESVYLIETINEEMIAKQIKKIVTEKEQARIKGHKAKIFVEENFNFDVSAKAIFKFLQSFEKGRA